MKITILILLLTSSLFSQKFTDTYNVYFTSDHFQVITGIKYKDDNNSEIFANKLLDAAEFTYSKIVTEFGFKAPIKSDVKLMDIYIGDRKAYDYINDIYITIASEYAGWANYYNTDQSAYFVINPTLNDNIIKVTIAHEFFHTIQHSYIDDTLVSYSKYLTSVWWIEATAVLMEDEVYDKINDYVYFINRYSYTSYKSIETFDGNHEYSMVIFAKYIREKYGIKIIEDTLSLFESSEYDGFFEILDYLLNRDYDSSMKDSLNEFSLWVSDMSYYFEEGSIYSPLKRYKYTDNKSVEKGGVLLLENDIEYTLSENNYFNQIYSNSNEIIISNFNSYDVVVKKTEKIYLPNITNVLQTVEIKTDKKIEL